MRIAAARRGRLPALVLCAVLAGCSGLRPHSGETADAARNALFRRLTSLVAPTSEGRPDYAPAVREVEQHLALHPAEERRPDIATVHLLLRKLSASAALADQLQTEARTRRAEVDRLGRDNQELKAIVDRLKALDLDMEMKRGRFR
jgi:hypothetical protein